MSSATLEAPTEVPEFDEARYNEGRYDGILEVMDKSGDVKIMWDRTKADEVAVAEKTFKSAQKKGMLVYKTDANGNKGEQTREFDQTAERLIATPQLVGG